MSTLGGTEKISRPAEFQIAHRDAESGAELCVLPKSCEPFAGEIEDPPVPLQQQVSVSLMGKSTDPAADLVKLRKAETIGRIDNDRVAVRDIDSRFDDCRADQNIVLAVDKFSHDPLELMFFHLAVTDDDPGFRHQLAQAGSDSFDRADAIMQIKDLTAAPEFVADSIGYEFFVIIFNNRFDRKTVYRSRFDHAQIPRAGQRHVERSRNRRGAHRKNIDRFAHPFELFFLPNAEAMFLVNDEQTDIGKSDLVCSSLTRNIASAFGRKKSSTGCDEI